MNLDKLVDSWIGNEQMHTLPSEYVTDGKPHETEFDRGHNSKIQDLKSRKQELIEIFEDWLVDIDTTNIDEEMFMERILKKLTGK